MYSEVEEYIYILPSQGVHLCNSLNASLTLFNFVVVCDPEQIPAVERALRKCYDHISRLYAYNKAEPVHPGKLNELTIECY